MNIESIGLTDSNLIISVFHTHHGNQRINVRQSDSEISYSTESLYIESQYNSTQKNPSRHQWKKHRCLHPNMELLALLSMSMISSINPLNVLNVSHEIITMSSSADFSSRNSDVFMKTPIVWSSPIINHRDSNSTQRNIHGNSTISTPRIFQHVNPTQSTPGNFFHVDPTASISGTEHFVNYTNSTSNDHVISTSTHPTMNYIPQEAPRSISTSNLNTRSTTPPAPLSSSVRSFGTHIYHTENSTMMPDGTMKYSVLPGTVSTVDLSAFSPTSLYSTPRSHVIAATSTQDEPKQTAENELSTKRESARSSSVSPSHNSTDTSKSIRSYISASHFKNSLTTRVVPSASVSSSSLLPSLSVLPSSPLSSSSLFSSDLPSSSRILTGGCVNIVSSSGSGAEYPCDEVMLPKVLATLYRVMGGMCGK